MYREKIKVLDCTIRDGGLINNHNFDQRFVREVYRAISLAGVDYMEIGYKNSKELFSSAEYGPWKFCDDDDIKRVTEGIESHTKLSVMVDIGRVVKCLCPERMDVAKVAVFLPSPEAEINDSSILF